MDGLKFVNEILSSDENWDDFRTRKGGDWEDKLGWKEYKAFSFAELIEIKLKSLFLFSEKIAVGKFVYPIIEADIALFIVEKFEIFIVQDFELLQIVTGTNRKAILSIDDINDILDNQDSIELLLDSKCCDFKLYGDISTNSEASVREFISPVLVLAGLIAKKFSMKAEKRITGSMGNGPLDYTYIYKDIDTAISEAKEDNIIAGVAQNIAQLVASREDFLFQHASEHTNKNKRKYRDYAGDIADIPSTGIVTTGENGYFKDMLQ
eukprot:gene16920-23222_t